MQIILLAALLCALAVSNRGSDAHMDSQPMSSAESWERIVQLVETEQYAAAYDKLVVYASFKGDAMILQLMGAVALKLQMHEAAAEHLSRAFSIDPRQPAAIHANYVLALHRSGDIDIATTVAARALQDFPDSWVLLQNVAELFAAISHPDVAGLYAKLCSLETSRAISHACLTAIMMNKRSEVALHALLSAVESGPMDAYRRHIVADFAAQAAILDEGWPLNYSEACQESIRQVVYDGGGVATALAIAREISEQLLHDPVFLLDLGSLLYFNGEYAASLSVCQEAATIDPRSAMIQSCVGAAAVYQQDEELAVSSLRRALHLLESGSGSAVLSRTFSVDAADLNFNLMSALSTFKRFHACADMALSALELPDWRDGGAIVLALSMVSWSRQNMLNFIQPLEKELIAQQRLVLPIGRNFRSYIDALKEPHNSLLLPVASSCVSSLGHVGAAGYDAWGEASGLLQGVMRSVEEKNGGFNSLGWQHPGIRGSGGGVVLMTQLFSLDPGDSDAAVVWEDLSRALRLNLKNGRIDHAVLFCDREYDLMSMFGQEAASKIIVVPNKERLTFQTAFKFANKYMTNKTIILANSDIYFEEKGLARLGDTSTLSLHETVLALSKWTRSHLSVPEDEVSSSSDDDSLQLPLRIESQDAWVFTSPIPDTVVSQVDFALGAPRCDNVLAAVLAREGFLVLNPAFAVRAVEFDARVRRGALYGQQGAVLGTGRYVFFSDKFIF